MDESDGFRPESEGLSLEVRLGVSTVVALTPEASVFDSSLVHGAADERGGFRPGGERLSLVVWPLGVSTAVALTPAAASVFESSPVQGALDGLDGFSPGSKRLSLAVRLGFFHSTHFHPRRGWRLQSKK